MRDDEVRSAYTEWAAEYTSRLGSMAATHPEDRALVAGWAASRSGPVLDVGCGPGHWTDFLHQRGLDVRGIDLTPDLVAAARQNFPALDVSIGSLHGLALPDAHLDGVLAWYSVIHHEPADLPGVLAELARVIAPGGSLLLGFFTGPELEPFDHTVTTAWFWPVPLLTTHLTTAGFEVQQSHTRTDEGHRPHGALVARRR